MQQRVSKKEQGRLKVFFHGVQGRINARTKRFEQRWGLPIRSRGRVSYSDLMEKYFKYEGKCAYCEAKLAIMQRRYGKTVKRLTFDHVLSLHNGGRTEIENLVPSCQFCNQDKGEKEYNPQAVVTVGEEVSE